MLTNLIKELKVLAETILEEDQSNDLESRLIQSRQLYEKLLVMNHLTKDKAISEIVEIDIAEEVIEEKSVETLEEVKPEVIVEPEPPVENTGQRDASESKDDDAPLSLNDLFVPTFDGIKEDFSQKEEFKDTISLDETENMFEVKKEAPRQLSLNDKLVGNSIQVGLNDRIAFVNKLFNFSQSDFNKALSRLNECNSKDEALKYFQYQVKPNYNWKGKEELEERLRSLIERKFM